MAQKEGESNAFVGAGVVGGITGAGALIEGFPLRTAATWAFIAAIVGAAISGFVSSAPRRK